MEAIQGFIGIRVGHNVISSKIPEFAYEHPTKPMSQELLVAKFIDCAAHLAKQIPKVLLGLIDEGLIPMLFAEGSYNTRLEIIRDLPKGKVVWRFDQTDMARAKEVLGDRACIYGNVSVAILSTGTTDDVKAYCKQLIDVAGKGGGFILSSGATLDTAKPENVRAMIEFTKQYGIYE
jgi:hypothetical protein